MLQFSITGRPAARLAVLVSAIVVLAACSGTGGRQSSGSSTGAGAAGSGSSSSGSSITGGAEGAPTDQATPGARTPEGVPTTSGGGSSSGSK
ncbi:hypothetical protein [Noviherbaspirillum sp. Root189]|uniref:hypothetical protein n=1 Tax=Noviherbaspirillum sp. Root189 TaxID=1736487 RepID=UPI000A77EC1E|nr:hypothetical protein [Noviherbaspirillum sp. Root189]